MSQIKQARVVFIKPAKIDRDGYPVRYRKGFMPNPTGPYIAAMTPERVGDTVIERIVIDEVVHTDLNYLNHLQRRDGVPTLFAAVGAQSNQFHRAADLAAFALEHGCATVIGGAHAETCDTSMLENRGVSFSKAEAEVTWPEILQDFLSTGELKPTYGRGRRWTGDLDKAPRRFPRTAEDLARYVVPMEGERPTTGCPWDCSFCSVTQKDGRQERDQPIETTIANLKTAISTSSMVMMVSDNLNQWNRVDELLDAIIVEKLKLTWFCQCDTRLVHRPELVKKMAQAGCTHIFFGIEAVEATDLAEVHKGHNKPINYDALQRLCRDNGIVAHFSYIIGLVGDTRESILARLARAKELGSGDISCYILTPIPGTKDYAKFREKGWIASDENLDHFDTMSLSWKHPRLSQDELDELLYRFYAEYYSLDFVWREVKWAYRSTPIVRAKIGRIATAIGLAAFARYCAFQHQHPMSGGIWRVKLDHVDEYIAARARVFGYTRFPLPDNIESTEREKELLRVANPAILQLIKRGEAIEATA